MKARVIVAGCACAVMAASAAPARAAIAFRAASTAFTTIPALTLPITVPNSVAAGDLLLATITVRSATLTASAPSGWTLRIDTAGNNMRQVTLWRFADANDAGTTYSFSLSGAVRATGAISAYSGVDTTTPTTPIDASAGSIDAVSGTSATPPQVPTTFLRAAVVVATSWTTSGTTVGEGTGTTERYESASANNSTLEAADYIQGAPGASTPPAVTASSSSHWVAQTIALNEMPSLTASFPSDYGWTSLVPGTTSTSTEQIVNVTSNRLWGLQLSSDRSDGRSRQWNGTSYGALSLANPLQWRTSSLGGVAQGTSFANVSSTAATAGTGQAASASTVPVGITFRQQVSYADEAALPAGNTYRQNVSYTAQQGF